VTTNPFASGGEYERPRRPQPSPFRRDPFEQVGNPFAAPLSDADARYWTALLVFEISEFLDGAR